MKNASLFIICLIIVGCFGKNAEKTGHEGEPLPSFKLFLADSVTYFDTKSIPNGKPVVLFYFGPHCPYSKSQMKEITNNIESLKDIQFYIFTTWPFNDLKKFYTDYNLNKYSNIVVGVDYTNFFANYLPVQGVPYTAIYDNHKVLKQAFIGKVNSNQIKSTALD